MLAARFPDASRPTVEGVAVRLRADHGEDAVRVALALVNLDTVG